VQASLLALAGMGAAVMLSGCASIVTGTTQRINVSTPPTTGAVCTLASTEGRWTLTSPGSVTVSKSKNDIRVDCAKSGWQEGSGIIPSGCQGWTLGNLLIGGLLGIAIDAMTGAMHQYPSNFQVPMQPAAPPVAAPPEAPVPGSPKDNQAPGS